jgi:hypothetical protein
MSLTPGSRSSKFICASLSFSLEAPYFFTRSSRKLSSSSRVFHCAQLSSRSNCAMRSAWETVAVGSD